MKQLRCFRMCFALFAASGAVDQSASAEWPNFRGPNFDGISKETGLIASSERPLKLLWERNIGSAFSSFAAVGDRIYTCGMGDGEQILYCLNVGTGEIVWKKPFEKEFRNEYGDGTRATPTVHEDRVYILGARGKLLCVDAQKGDRIWEETFSHIPMWAYSGSVLIEGDLAVSSGGADDGALVAFNKKTGKQVWKTGADPVGYSTPYPFTFDDKRYIAGFTGKSVMIVDAKTGKLVLQQSWETDWQVNAAMPIFYNGHLLVSSGYRTGTGLFKLRAQSEKLTADEVWASKVLLNKFQSSILLDGFLYASDEKALKCVEFMTGKEMWKQPRVANGTIVAAEGNLYLLTEEGQLRVGKANPKGFEPTITADILTDRCWSVPVIHQGRLYARNMDRVVCYDLKK